MKTALATVPWYDRLAEALPAVTGTVGTRGDFDLNPDMTAPEPLTPASVLVPLVNHASGPTVLLTQRTAGLTSHAGQISFPGGRREAGDADAVATALRETQEEIALPPENVRVLGRLDTYIVRSGYAVVPIVGLVDPIAELLAEPLEVAEIFEVPLDFFLSAGMPQTHSRRFLGKERHFYVFPYNERYIWGATAGMLRNFREILEPSWPR